jgi:ABC-type iron transport system FetAB ATPase subunit
VTADPGLGLRVRQAVTRLEREAGQAQEVARRGKEKQAEVARLRRQAELQEKVAALLNSVGEERQESARRQVEELVTRALQVIFEKNLSFHMESSVRANRAEVDFVIRSAFGDQVVDTPVLEARGGGMAAVVGFVLRLVVLLLTPGARRFLALDESFAHVSASYEPRVAEFIREVADKAGVQVLLVTHSDAYGDLADRKYRLTLGPDGVTRVEEGSSELG